jgi:hypothetical protein
MSEKQSPSRGPILAVAAVAVVLLLAMTRTSGRSRTQDTEAPATRGEERASRHMLLQAYDLKGSDRYSLSTGLAGDGDDEVGAAAQTTASPFVNQPPRAQPPTLTVHRLFCSGVLRLPEFV